MPNGPNRFSIIFDELAKQSDQPEVQIAADEFQEYDEIRALREIVLDTQTPDESYVTST